MPQKLKNITKQALQAYTTLLKYSQLAVNHQINFRNVQLSNSNHIHQIYTSKIHSQQTKHLVLLHGFAGSAMSYIRTFNHLSKYYHVHALDHYGNGFSSRGEGTGNNNNNNENNLNSNTNINININDNNNNSIDNQQSVTTTLNNNSVNSNVNQNQKQILSLYINSIQQWRKNIGINNLILVGHSFGGYLAALYTLQHLDVVDRLILLSPVGTSNQTQIHQQIQSRKTQSLKNKIILNLVQKIYNMKIQPSKAFNLPFLGDFLVNSFLKSEIKLQKQQKQMWKHYIKYINQQQSHLQKSFYQCFDWPFVAKLTSISDILQKIIQKDNNIQIQFYYGEKDWTQQIGAKKLIKKYRNIHFQIIPEATHNMIFDFPFEVSDRIISGPLKDRIEFSKL